MTAATLHTDIVPSRQGWRALLWIALLTALWVPLNYAFPIIPAGGMSTVAARLAIHADRVGVVARSRARRANAGPAAQCVARRDDPVHAMAGADLGFGDQRRVPGRGRTVSGASLRDLPAGDHRHTYHAAVEADGAGARRDPGELADRAAGLSRAWQRLPDWLGPRARTGRLRSPGRHRRRDDGTARGARGDLARCRHTGSAQRGGRLER